MDAVEGMPRTRRDAREERAISAAPAPPAPRVHRSGGRRSSLLSLSTVFVVGALLVAGSVPSNAFVSDAAVLAPQGLAAPATQPAQSMAVADAVQAAIPVRDQFSTTTYAQQLQLKYANGGGSYSATTGSIRWPFPYTVTITDGFGLRSASISGRAMHNGTDFTPGAGTPIYAIADGVVTLHDDNFTGFGNHVIIQHVIAGQKVESMYAHMQNSSSPLAVGSVVKVGDFVGLVGDSGNSYGAHLHLEIHVNEVPVDPFAWLSANATN